MLLVDTVDVFTCQLVLQDNCVETVLILVCWMRDSVTRGDLLHFFSRHLLVFYTLLFDCEECCFSSLVSQKQQPGPKFSTAWKLDHHID